MPAERPRDEPRVQTWLTDRPLNPAGLLESVGGPGAGAVVLFVGRVREMNRERAVARLRYEAYREMAEAELRRIAQEMAAGFGVGAIAAVHRVGTLEPGEESVAIAVAAPHREAAYAASRAVIEGIKERLPVWKREEYADGTADWLGPGEEAAREAGRDAPSEVSAS